MENELSAAQNAAYDYRRCARVWQRVDPTLDPYPDVRAAAAMAADTPGRRSERRRAERRLTLPARRRTPAAWARRRWSRWRCCRASSARSSPTGGPISSSRGARRQRRRGRCSAPSRRTRGGTPGVFSPRSISSRASAIAPRSAILRCAATAIAPHCGSGITRKPAAASTIAAPRGKRSTPALQQLLLAFSQDEYRHANAMLCLLSGVM